MHTADESLCEELFKLRKWDSTYIDNYCHGCLRSKSADWDTQDFHTHYPAYTLGFLQRKLRDYAEDYNGEGLEYIMTSREPENDMVRLAIELFNDGTLPYEQDS